MNLRWLIWLTLLACAAWLVWSSDSQDTEISAPVREGSEFTTPASWSAARSNAQARRKMDSVTLEQLAPRSELFPARPASKRRDLFAATFWSEPPPIATTALAEPLPPPPPAFSYLGRQYDGQDWEVFLSLADRTYIAKAGAVLDESYRVERIDATVITLLDLRTSQSQTISIGDVP